MNEELPWFHTSPLLIEKIVFTERCLQTNTNLNPRVLARIQYEFTNKKPYEHTRPKQCNQKWPEGVYVGGTRFQLNCTEKDGLILITSMSYDKRAFRKKKEGERSGR